MPRAPQGPQIRLLTQTELALSTEPDGEDGEPVGWSHEYIYEVALPGTPDKRLVRVWFEASGHGEAEADDDVAGSEEPIEVWGRQTTPNELVTVAMMLGWTNDRRWVEFTEAHDKDAEEQNMWGNLG